MEADQRMRPADRPPLRNPFGIVAEDAPVEPDPHELAATAWVESNPDGLGLTLSSTLVGVRQRMALVNGQIYEEGAKLDHDSGMQFVVARIEPGRVVLEAQGRTIELMIEPPTRPSQPLIHRRAN